MPTKETTDINFTVMCVIQSMRKAEASRAQLRERIFYI